MRRLVRPSEEDGFALVLSLLLILVVAGLSLSMAAVILNQAQPTQESRKALTTVNAAQSGLQAALLTLRAANDGAGNGVLNKVPCTAGLAGASFSTTSTSTPVTARGTSLSGVVSTAAGTGSPTYRVSIAYYRENPAGQDLVWLVANAMPCPLVLVPSYAYLQSYGAGAPVPGDAATQGNRTQIATYRFSTSNTNIIGGRMRSYKTQECIDAGDAPVTAGRLLTMAPCLALGTARQTWQYRRDLTIFYGGDTTQNLCVQAPVTGDRPFLAVCTGSGAGATYPYSAGQQVQEWGFNDNGHFGAALNDGTVAGSSSAFCLQPRGAGGSTAAPSGADLAYVSCDTNTDGPAAFDPDAQVGAGKAGGAVDGVPGGTKQFVNYAQFGRCLDITGQNVNADHLIAYPCKQSPDSTKLTFNQVWTYSAATSVYGTFYVNNNGTTYCLTAPATGKLVTTTPCATTTPAPDNQFWVASGLVVSSYAASYTLISKSSLLCMGVSPLSEATTFGSSNITVTACDGSAAQKWNAPPIDPTSLLGNIAETTVSGG